MLEFSLQSKDFNLQNAYNCCLLSKAAYLPKELIGHQLIEEFGMSEVKKFSNLNCKGFIASSEQVNVISFTGSEFDLETWQENIDALFSPGPSYEVSEASRPGAKFTHFLSYCGAVSTIPGVRGAP